KNGALQTRSGVARLQLAFHEERRGEADHAKRAGVVIACGYVSTKKTSSFRRKRKRERRQFGLRVPISRSGRPGKAFERLHDKRHCAAARRGVAPTWAQYASHLAV